VAVVYVHSACVNTYCGVFVNANWRFCSLSECDPNDVDSAADRYCERFYVYCFKAQVKFLSKIFLAIMSFVFLPTGYVFQSPVRNLERAAHLWPNMESWQLENPT